MPDSSPHAFTSRNAESDLARVCVIIPTFRRPQGLETAMRSIRAQADAPPLSLIVCDNSPEASARALVEGFEAPFPVTYIHEPKTGVANARNSAVAVCDSDFIAFLDDDEEAPADWLNRLMAAQRQFDADVVFGPVTARIPEATRHNRPYYEHFFSRFGPAQSEILPHYYGCGNSLLKSAALTSKTPFSTLQNEMGGEDDILFTAMKAEGRIMAWAADAPVFEDVPPTRATLAYTLKRGFAYGQGPSHSSGVNGRLLACAGWMAQGLVQAGLFGVASLVLFAIRHPRRAFVLDKAARGLGKTLWFAPFKMKFYGQTLLKKDEKTKT
ncbi:glycosyltransferase family 2 protein [Asticcacaulis sp.]|uniref:glycosyltransferase family 2 protein n=1 Tax=Asticcacaulis sp. TaxID=1872648 RepID=UPI003F7C38A9